MSVREILAAIEAVETSGGKNVYPRFEPGYAPKDAVFTIQGHLVKGTGANFNNIVAARWAKWGMASACSYSRWQILYHVAADRGLTSPPWVLWDSLVAEGWVRAEILRQFSRGATTIEKMARAWNGGNPNALIPQKYIDDLTEAYRRAGGNPDLPLEVTT